MISSARARLAATAALLVLGALASSATATAAPTVNGVFPVPGVETNNKIVAGPEGDIWVTLGGLEQNVARVTPAGEVKEFELGLEFASGIAVGPENKIWVAAKEAVAAFSPANPEGTVAETTMPALKTFYSIVAGPEGKMWVATSENVLRFSPVLPILSVEETPIAELAPHDIDVDGSGVAVADGGAPRIVLVSGSLGVSEFSYGATGGSQGLAVSPGGQIGFSDPGVNPEMIGLITPPGPATTLEQEGDPFGVTLGADGAFWFAQFNDGELVRLSSTGEKTFLPGLPKESARQITTGPGNTLWATLVKAGEEGVVRISGVEPPPQPAPPATTAPGTTTKPTTTPKSAPPAPPQTLIGKGPKGTVTAGSGGRAKVSFRFSSTTAGAAFQCALVKAKKGRKPAARFAACRSPRSYTLAPGKYRFSVRAVAGGSTDASPAVRSFRVLAARAR
jgi:streptogramin lyase